MGLASVLTEYTTTVPRHLRERKLGHVAQPPTLNGSFKVVLVREGSGKRPCLSLVELVMALGLLMWVSHQIGRAHV